MLTYVYATVAFRTTWLGESDDSDEAAFAISRNALALEGWFSSHCLHHGGVVYSSAKHTMDSRPPRQAQKRDRGSFGLKVLGKSKDCLPKFGGKGCTNLLW